MQYAEFFQTVAPTTVIILLAAGLIVALARGWIFTAFQVSTLLSQANQRSEDYKELYEKSEAAKEILLTQLDKLTVVAEGMDRILSAIPSPRLGDTTEKVST